MIKAILGSALLALAVTAAPSAAAIVTFAPLTNVDEGPAGDGTTYLENGLTFTSSISVPNALFHWGTSQSFNADPTGATLFQNYPFQSLIVTRTGGGSFTLESLDLADAFNFGDAGIIAFDWVDGDGAHSMNLTLDSLVGLQTFTLGLTGVTSFALRQDSPYFQIDNIVYDATVVPEPASWALMIAGFGMIGAAIRRRATVVAA